LVLLDVLRLVLFDVFVFVETLVFWFTLFDAFVLVELLVFVTVELLVLRFVFVLVDAPV